MMHDQGRAQDVLKCPSELQAIMGRGQGYIGVAEGKALRAWVDGATQVDPAIEHARGMLLNSCEGGIEAFRKAWNAQTKEVRTTLGAGFRDQCAASAKAYDEARQQPAGEGAEAFAALNQVAAQQPPVPPAAPEPTPEPAPAPATVAAPAAPDDEGVSF
jgi:hypothetical protein